MAAASSVSDPPVIAAATSLPSISRRGDGGVTPDGVASFPHLSSSTGAIPLLCARVIARHG